MYKPLLIIISLMISIQTVFAATIYGNIYDMELNLAKDVVISVNTIPKQTFVSKNGSFTFDLSPGNYHIEAKLETDRKYFYTENITITDDKDYVFDIILFPDFSDINELIDSDVIDSGVDENLFEGWDHARSKYGLVILYLSVILLLIALLIVFYTIKMKKNEKSDIVDDLENSVLDFIKKNDGKTTQKDIRKSFPFSEAKISLVISKLEADNKIRKIKKGRGNLIILNE